MRLRRLNTLTAGVARLLILSPIVVNTRAEVAADDPSKRVKIVGGAIELVEVTPTAPKSGKQKGKTMRLRVTSETPIDVNVYIQVGYHQGINKDFGIRRMATRTKAFVATRNRITRSTPTLLEVLKRGQALRLQSKPRNGEPECQK